jgi:hypothetical protein
VDCQRYDPHDLRLVLFFQRRDHDERRYERLLLLHGVDALPRLVPPDGDGNTVRFREHCDRQHDDDGEQNERGEQHHRQCLHLCGTQHLPSFLVVA